MFALGQDSIAWKIESRPRSNQEQRTQKIKEIQKIMKEIKFQPC